MMAVGGLKAAAKRTAFGDVSNTTKDVNSARDTSTATGGKPLSQTFIRPVGAQENGAPENVAAFLRPAQRPLNASQKLQPVPAKRSSGPILMDTQHVQPSHRISSKPSTTIYKDSSTVDPPSQPVVQNYLPVLAGPVVQNLAPRHYKSQPYLKPDQSALPFAQYKPVKPVVIEPIACAPSSDPIYEDAPEQPLAQSPKDSYGSYMKLIEYKENDAVHEVPKIAQVTIEEVQHRLPALPQLSEPEEYWDEEEDDEIYDEQGYTTAHSYRSRGDNTTGGATTVLLPKITNKVKKELAEAKELVECARTPEEIDDEAWDTSMVAEYGDEIFAYMRELEVSSSFYLPNISGSPHIAWCTSQDKACLAVYLVLFILTLAMFTFILSNTC
jgi:G2/mitotic-specific cyclin 3/4